MGTNDIDTNYAQRKIFQKIIFVFGSFCQLMKKQGLKTQSI